MTARTTESYARCLRDAKEFSLVLGGPLFQLLLRSHLSSDSLTLVARRIIVFVVITWVPLLALAAHDGHLLDGDVAVPFVRDLETHIRFLVVVYGVGVLIVWRHTALDVSTWYAHVSAGSRWLYSAGIWYAYVSLPIFQFLLLRWYWRLYIWIRFLWQVSRLELSLVPTHPDLLGGLGFLANTVFAFSVLLVAHGAMLAAQIANRIFFGGAALQNFKEEIFVMLVFLLCLVFGPLLVFSPQLSRAKRQGLLEYGALAERYVRDFDGKWLRRGAQESEPLMGSADIQSLADMGNSFAVVRTMRLAPIGRDAVLELAACVLVPLAPLLLTIMPVEDLVKKLFGLVF